MRSFKLFRKKPWESNWEDGRIAIKTKLSCATYRDSVGEHEHGLSISVITSSRRQTSNIVLWTCVLRETTRWCCPYMWMMWYLWVTRPTCRKSSVFCSRRSLTWVVSRWRRWVIQFPFWKGRTRVSTMAFLWNLIYNYIQKMLEAFEERFDMVRIQQVPADGGIQVQDGSQELNGPDSTTYRSVTGMALYLAQKRYDIAYCIKGLAWKMKPTVLSLQRLRKLLGYLKGTQHYALKLTIPAPGVGKLVHSDCQCVLESYSDNDWSGHRSHRRSTSASLHFLNGNLLFGASRTQKVVSLSSAEAELHSLVLAWLFGVYFEGEGPSWSFGGQLGAEVPSKQERNWKDPTFVITVALDPRANSRWIPSGVTSVHNDQYYWHNTFGCSENQKLAFSSRVCWLRGWATNWSDRIWRNDWTQRQQQESETNGKSHAENSCSRRSTRYRQVEMKELREN